MLPRLALGTLHPRYLPPSHAITHRTTKFVIRISNTQQVRLLTSQFFDLGLNPYPIDVVLSASARSPMVALRCRGKLTEEYDLLHDFSGHIAVDPHYPCLNLIDPSRSFRYGWIKSSLFVYLLPLLPCQDLGGRPHFRTCCC